MKCTAGVRTAPMGAGWTWNTLADSAFSHHIPSLAPAVALPAPRHDRRRTGAAGSPPGGFPFVEFRCADVKWAYSCDVRRHGTELFARGRRQAAEWAARQPSKSPARRRVSGLPWTV